MSSSKRKRAQSSVWKVVLKHAQNPHPGVTVCEPCRESNHRRFRAQIKLPSGTNRFTPATTDILTTLGHQKWVKQKLHQTLTGFLKDDFIKPIKPESLGKTP